MEECLICFEPLGNNYAIVNNDAERGFYHIGCLEEWLRTHSGGIVSQNKITSYIVFENNIAREVIIGEDEPTPGAFVEIPIIQRPQSRLVTRSAIDVALDIPDFIHRHPPPSPPQELIQVERGSNSCGCCFPVLLLILIGGFICLIIIAVTSKTNYH